MGGKSSNIFSLAMKNLDGQKETLTTPRKQFHLIQQKAVFGPIPCLSVR